MLGDINNPMRTIGGSQAADGSFSTAPSQDNVAASQTINAVNANPNGPTTATAGSTATIDVSGRATLEIAVTAAGGGTGLVVQASSDKTNWITLAGAPLVNQSTGLQVANSITGTGIWTLNVADLNYVRISSLTGFTGSATIILGASSTLSAVSIDNVQLPVYPVAPSTQWQASATDTVNTSQAVKAAAGAGLRNYVTDLTLSNSSAAAVLVQLLDGAAVMWQAVVPAGATIIENFSTPLKGTANTAVNVLAGAATATLYVSAAGYTAA